MNELLYVLDTKNSVPLYKQLYLFIRNDIRASIIANNQKLPSKRNLSKFLGISQNTVQTAYNQLLEEGYIISIERKGYYVSQLEDIIKYETKIFTDSKIKINELPVKYDFSINSVDRSSFPYLIWRKLFKETINESDETLLQAVGFQGDKNLRESIAHYLHQSRGVNCSLNQIIISSGTEFLIQFIIQLLGKNVIYGLENPGYDKLRHVLKMNNSKIIPLSVDSEGISLNNVKINDVNVLCITPSHQFPTGTIMPISRRIQLINWANNSDDRYIIEDDYDSEFKYSGKPIPSLQGLDNNGKVIYLGSFSKSLAPSIRISYMVLPQSLLQSCYNNLSFMLCSVPLINQKMLNRFIVEGYFERHLNKMRTIYRRKYDILIQSILKLNQDIEIFGADAGLHILLKVNNGMTENELVEIAHKNGIEVYGITSYYIDQNLNAEYGYILIGYANLSETEISHGISLLGSIWFKES